MSVVTFELGINVFGLCTEVLLSPNLTVQFGVVYEGHASFGRSLNVSGSNLFLIYPKQIMLLLVVPEDSDAGHLLVERFHVSHLGLMLFFGQLCYII